MADYTVTGDTRLDTSGFTKGISSMTVAAGNLISGLVSTATSKLAGLAKSSVSVGMSFQASMSQVAATMGTTTDQIQSLTDKAMEMGRTTAFTATDAAQALNYLALAGYDATKAAEVLPSVLNLAAAGGMDLAYASDLVTDAMASLQIEASKSNVDEFGNKLAMAASKANANVSQLGEAILTVGGTAANLKGGTTELTTALGLLANVGIKGAEGGTHLRNIILSLQSPTDEAAKKMEKLGLAVYDSQGQMRGLDEILGDLNRAMAGMTQGQKDSIINQLFNKTDLAAVNGLLAAQGEQWDTLAAQIEAAGDATGDAGAMAQMAETQLDNLDGAVKLAQNAFEGLQLAVYDGLEPTLTQAAQSGAQIITTLTEALTDGGPEAMLAAAGGILADLAQGIVEQLPGLVTTGVEIITQLTQDITAATPAMLDTAAEVLGALVEGLGTVLPQLVDAGIEMISQLGQGAVQGIPEFLAQVLPVVADFASGLRENAGKLVDAGIELIFNLMQGLMDGLPTIIEQVPGIVSDLAGVINDNAPKILMAGAHLIVMLGEGLWNALPTIIENIPQICKAIFDVFTAFRWLDIGKQIVEGLWNGLKSGWTGLVSKVQGLVQQLPDVAKKILGIHSPSRVFSEIGKFLCEGFANGIREHTPEVTDAATEMADGVIDAVKDTIPDTLDGLWSDIKDRASEGILGTVDTLWSAVKSGDWLSIGKWVASTLYSGLTADQKQQLKTYALSLVDTLNGVLGDASQNLAQQAVSIGQSLFDGITGKFGDIMTLAAKMGGTLKSTFSALAAPLSAAAKAISTGLSGGLMSMFPAIYAGFAGMIGTIGAAVEGMLAAVSAALSSTIFGIPAGIVVAAAAVALAATIATIVSKLGGSHSSSGSSGCGSSGSSGSSGLTSDMPSITDDSNKLTDAIDSNTAKLTEINKSLTKLVKSANALVLSDNMAVSSRVAASGTAQLAAAANSYHREGDTNITQNIYSKAQTAADLQREARWEADKARAQRR